MTIEDTLYRAVLDWLKVGCVAYGATPLTDSQVVRSKQVNAANVRPPKPYLTVNLVASDVPVGVDEDVDAVSGSDPTRTVYGVRTGTVSVQGYGSEAYDWLTLARTSLRRDSVQRQLKAAGLTVYNQSGVTDLSVLLDTSFEPRYLKEFSITYRVFDDPETLTELGLVSADLTYPRYPGDPDALISDIDIIT